MLLTTYYSGEKNQLKSWLHNCAGCDRMTPFRTAITQKVSLCLNVTLNAICFILVTCSRTVRLLVKVQAGLLINIGE